MDDVIFSKKYNIIYYELLFQKKKHNVDDNGNRIFNINDYKINIIQHSNNDDSDKSKKLIFICNENNNIKDHWDIVVDN